MLTQLIDYFLLVWFALAGASGGLRMTIDAAG